ncbi:hypothetical protein BerOc1_01951 [Pseudodesulfovibrio hydrargyri]|uniref:Uncharacterized protein n=1 Tax=Pseudodesulfovibrio hydrargyri TaxID=2125990 RepID=A0A1J5MTR5_9BACT|nr:hypothetical protein BerOc1_01951 [Pseudodesulfovibrio hydrargyri]
MEPVRREGNLNRKYHGNKRSLDWWTVDKPVDWNPRDEGKRVSLNHDYGKRDKPAGPEGAGADSGRAAGPSPAPARAKPKGRSTLNQGADGFWEYEARREAEAKAQPRSGPTPAADPAGPGAGRTPGSPSGKSEETNDAAATAGALGGMVQSKGQHGKGKLTSNDPKAQELMDKFGGKREDFKREANKELNALSDQAKKATSPKERNQLLRRKDAIKGAIKLMDRELLKMPLITSFTVSCPLFLNKKRSASLS